MFNKNGRNDSDYPGTRPNKSKPDDTRPNTHPLVWRRFRLKLTINTIVHNFAEPVHDSLKYLKTHTQKRVSNCLNRGETPVSPSTIFLRGDLSPLPLRTLLQPPDFLRISQRYLNFYLLINTRFLHPCFTLVVECLIVCASIV